jgi:alanine dehydrogenase
MPLSLTESDVERLFPMWRALERVEASFVAQHAGKGINRSRQRILLPGSSLHYMAAALVDEKLLGMKVYTVAGEALRFLVLLYSTERGELLAIVEADLLGRIRTGAASGVATKYLARSDAARAGVIGTGRQARTQLEAVALVRKIVAARVFGRDRQRLEAFCRQASERLGFEVAPAESVEAAVRFGDILVTATTAREPVLYGEWLQPGAHINAIGANMANRRELDDAAIGRAALIAVDSLQQAREEAGDLILGLANLGRDWSEVRELHDVVAGKAGRSSGSDITVFKSCGIALWDVAAAGHIYQQARAQGMGREFEFSGAVP